MKSKSKKSFFSSSKSDKKSQSQVERAFHNIEKQFTLKQPKQEKAAAVVQEEPHTCSCCEAGCSCCTHPSGRIVGCECRCTQTMHIHA